jgi:hypothetical protein
MHGEVQVSGSDQEEGQYNERYCIARLTGERGVALTRNDLRRLAWVRLKEARILLRSECWDGAYYLCGYAVECALKACIAKRTLRHEFPDKEIVTQSYSHNLTTLMATAGLDLGRKLASAPPFAVNWAAVKDWTEKSRYQANSRKKAQDLYRVVAARKHGLMRWVRQHW